MRHANARVQTPPGRGGIAVIALTGTDREGILAEVFRPLASHADAPPGAIQLGKFIDEAGEALDEAVVARTGEAIEINIHGGPVVARAALQRLGGLGATIEPARPAATESFSSAHPQWDNPAIGDEMLAILPDAASALVVAAVSKQWSAGLSQLASDPDVTADQLRAAAERFETMRKLLSPPDVVLVGPPNVGKSTLANVLVGRPISIVHETPGTTRDWVRERALLGGIPIWLTDTAGLFEFPDDPHGIEAESVRRARHRAEQADLVLLLSAGDAPTDMPDWLHAKTLLRIAAKADRLVGQRSTNLDYDATVSAETGEGLDDLKRVILTALGLNAVDPIVPAAFTGRQVHHLIDAANALDAGEKSLATEHLERLLRGTDDGNIRQSR